MTPRLPEILRTPSGKIELTPQPIMDDLPRVLRALETRETELVLVGRRHLRTNNSWMHNVPALVKGKPLCTLLVNPGDATKLGLTDGATAQVTSRVGKIEVLVEVTADIAPGVVSMPHGWGHDQPGTRLECGECARGRERQPAHRRPPDRPALGHRRAERHPRAGRSRLIPVPRTLGAAMTAGVASSNAVKTIRRIADIPFLAEQAWGDATAWRFKQHGEWREMSYAEVAERTLELASGFVHAGLKTGDRVCVLANTRPEWMAVELAVLAAGGIVVPIYPSSTSEEIAWVVGDSGASILVAEDEAQCVKVDVVRGELPELRTVFTIEPAGDRPTVAELQDTGRTSPLAAELDVRRGGIKPDDPSLIIYTSGTTGPPKGCVLTNANWVALCRVAEEARIDAMQDTVYLFLPLAHVFAQIVAFGTMYRGGALAFFGGDMKAIVPELAEVRPTFLPSVPRIFEKIYTFVTASVDPAQLAQAVKLGLEVRRRKAAGEPVPTEMAAAFEQVDALFAKVRGVFGGRLVQALSGAAPISREVLEFFLAAGVPVLEGYGMTESTAVGTVNTLGRFKLGSVGAGGVAGLEVAIGDDGEILMRGPHIFAGYWRNPEATAQTIQDGWLHTGDLGEIDENGFVTITGRKKDIIITAGGKNIAPANVENALRQSRWISHAVLFGDRKPYCVALITLDPDEVLPWAAGRGLPSDIESLVVHPDVRDLVQGVVDEANSHFASVSQVKKFVLLTRDLSQEEGELTPTLKVKRNVVHRLHSGLYEGLYE